ncbi:MAG: hypothetical protein Q9184_002777 [Pyrenodesmia sp. 2 TL-2023]
MEMTEKAKDKHDAIVKTISSQVQLFHNRGEKFRIQHGSTNSTRSTATKGRNFIDTSKLTNILECNEQQKTCLVEANVPMDRLVSFTLTHGLVPPVVMEFPGITVGGGFSGTSAESSSFKQGFFDRTINSIEMVLANGDIVTCSEEENTDLFRGAAGAMGTLGVVTLLEIRLIPATRYVRTSYHPIESVAAAVEVISKQSLNPSLDYLEGIMFSPTSGAVITGLMTNEQPSASEPIQTFTKPKDPWFYLHVQAAIVRSRSRSLPPITETIPITDYLFRYDRGAFWAAAYAFDYFTTPFNRHTRRLFDSLMKTRVTYKALDASHLAQRYVLQDTPVPFARAEEFILYTTRKFNIWPLWLCPLKPTPHPTINPFPASGDGASELLLNVGLWGPGPKRREEFVAVNRDLEAKLVELGGGKALYAHTYYTEGEFWRIYDKQWYDALREKYGATSLPTIYDKVKPGEERKKTLRDCVIDVRPLGGLYGVLKALQSDEYRQSRAGRGF